MTTVDRWLLPDGVEELLPKQAAQAERLRRQLLDLYKSWGYDLVIPPLIEFTESLLVSQSRDVDLQTFKVVDQLSGRTMGVRADITPQVARIDAHCLRFNGPVRLCYAGSVLHTRPKGLLASRSPFQLGAELYGDDSVDSDIEIISLMLETLETVGVNELTLDLGHVGIFRSLMAQANISEDAQHKIFDALQRKVEADLIQLVFAEVQDHELAKMITALIELNGGIEVIDDARLVLATANQDVHLALNKLLSVAETIKTRFPKVKLYFDLGELRGYHYHTGLVFGALAPGLGRAVANGGRYDSIGAEFGRARPATGFNTDIKALLSLLSKTEQEKTDGIWAPNLQDEKLWSAIKLLRSSGERVICALSDAQPVPGEVSCSRQLLLENEEWVVKPL